MFFTSVFFLQSGIFGLFGYGLNCTGMQLSQVDLVSSVDSGVCDCLRPQ